MEQRVFGGRVYRPRQGVRPGLFDEGGRKMAPWKPTSSFQLKAQQDAAEEESKSNTVLNETDLLQGSSSSSDAGVIAGGTASAQVIDEEELEPRVAYKVHLQKQEVREKYRRHEKDTGSPEVQIAALTVRIKHLTEHAKQHKHDYASIRGLIGLVNKRKRLLKYLRRFDDSKVIQLSKDLNIRVSRELVESNK